ncbi:MAG: hypothetical protein AAFP13_15820 [Pseudomonadota bacterium]
MIASGIDVLQIYGQVFWHALAVSFVAWLLLPVGLFMRERGQRSVVFVWRVLALTAAVGGAVLIFGAAHGAAQGAEAATSSFIHGLACAFGVASAMALVWALGRFIRVNWIAPGDDAAA